MVALKLIWINFQLCRKCKRHFRKNGGEKASSGDNIRKDPVEEMVDELMDYNDVMLFHGITEAE